MADTDPVATRPLLDGVAPTSWAEGSRRLAGCDTYWLATAAPDGRTHLRPVLAVWLDGGLHFCAGPATRKARNLAIDPRCVLAAGDDAADLVVEGQAVKVGDEAKLRRVAEAYAAKYGWRVQVSDGALHGDGAPTAGPAPYEVYAVAPTTVYAFGTTESFAPTRWEFAARS
jgi:Pyridoxamine 5'-phosphate oxidase